MNRLGSSVYTDLSWLTSAPDDFSANCLALSNATDLVGPAFQALAQCRLDTSQLINLSRSMASAEARGCSFAPLKALRIGLLSNATSSLIEHALIATAPRHGFVLKIAGGTFGQAMQDALSASSAVNSSQPSVVVCALDHRWYPIQACIGDGTKISEVVDACVSQLRSLVKAIRSHSGATCLLQTLTLPIEPLFGSLDRTVAGSLVQLTDRINQGIAELAQESESILLDVCTLSALVGNANWHDPAGWNEAKLPMHRSVLPLYADHVVRLVAAHQGKARRCLILDLDNTVWGGVVGDDGLEGIRIGQGDPVGEAHLDLQRFALRLRARGIVLAVCSKNTDEVARRPFVEHPDMLLKLDHIAVFQANWSDKASNIEAIARELSLGLESMVFVDDNPMERDLVRRMLPQVAVPELPADPANYVRTLSAAGYFDSTRFSMEDLGRADFYQSNSRRAALQQQAGDIDSYLASLEMQITFQPFDETGRTRIAQLISKSNQFNLTTRRYSESDLTKIQNDPHCYARQIRLTDIFGDNGMISVVIARQTAPQELEIDTWLMSCRVLGRRVENVVLQELVEYARSQKLRTLVGRYIPTERNALVKDHYRNLGFSLVTSAPDGTTVWHLDTSAASPLKVPMKILRLKATEALAEAVPPPRSPDTTELPLMKPTAITSTRVNGDGDRSPGKPPGRSLSLAEMTSIWTGIFLRDGLNAEDHFFELGGDSLMALTLVETVSDRLGRRIPLNAIVDSPTLGGFTRWVNDNSSASPALLVNLKPGTNGRRLYLIHGYGGSVMELRPLAQLLSGNYAVQGIRASGIELGEPIFETVESMAEAYLSEIRNEQPEGPYWLAGYSLGGLIAYRIAQLLVARGESVAGLVLLDSVIHPSSWKATVWVEFLARRARHHLNRMVKADRPLLHMLKATRSLLAHVGNASKGKTARFSAGDEIYPEHIQKVRAAGLRAYDSFAPGAVDLPITVIRSDLSLSNLPDPYRIWKAHAREVVVVDVAGDHASMIGSRHVKEMGAVLSRVLDGTDLA